MARSLLSQTLIRTCQPTAFFSPTRLLSLRAQSTLSDPSVADSDSDQREALAVQKIEDAIHGIIVRRSAPDWLPFIPGSSYWVPPRRRSYGIADLVDKLSNKLTDEEVMSLATARGWPSSTFFLHDVAEVEATSTKMSESEDVDG